MRYLKLRKIHLFYLLKFGIFRALLLKGINALPLALLKWRLKKHLRPKLNNQCCNTYAFLIYGYHSWKHILFRSRALIIHAYVLLTTQTIIFNFEYTGLFQKTKYLRTIFLLTFDLQNAPDFFFQRKNKIIGNTNIFYINLASNNFIKLIN